MNSRFSCHICSVGEMGDNQCRNCATSTEGLQPGKPEEEGDFLTKGIQGKAGKGRGRQECGKVDLAVLQLKSPDVMSCEEMKHCLRGEGLQVSGKKEVLMNRLIRHRAGEITAEGRLKSKKVVAERVRPQVDGSSVIPKTIKMKKFENLWYKKKKSYMDEYSEEEDEVAATLQSGVGGSAPKSPSSDISTSSLSSGSPHLTDGFSLGPSLSR